MPATRSAARKNRLKHFIAVLLLLGLMVGLAACRGFFGQAPIALLVVTLPADTQQVPVTVTFDISGSNDPDGTIVSYEVDYGDGSTKNNGTTIPTSSFTHPYAVGGIYTVILTVTDNDGRTGMDSATVVVGQEMVFFASKRSGNNYGIYRTMADGSGDGLIYDSPMNDELFPDVIRGTRDKIAYAEEDGTNWDIHTMTVTGVHISQLTTQTPSNEIQPSWSYDGSKIAYASNAAQTPSDTTWQIYTIDAVGGTPTQLPQSPSWAPAYSPTSDKIAFVSEKNNTSTGSALWLWNSPTTTATQLWPASSTAHTHRYGDASPTGFPAVTPALDLPDGISKPAWSPDGTKIAFSSNKAGAGKSDIYVINISTTGTASNERTLEAYVNSLITGTVTSGQITDTTKDEFCPYWLEDGSGLAFVRKVGVPCNIYKVSFTDGTVTPLTLTGDNVNPAIRDSKNGP